MNASRRINQASLDLSLNLYKQINGAPDGNVIFSPYSIAAAFSMVLLGAKENTAVELVKALGYTDESTSDVHQAQMETMVGLLKNSGKVTLDTANKLFIEQSYDLEHQYLEACHRYYDNEAESVDFCKSPENSRIKINKWVESKTKNKIVNLVPPGSIDSLTRLVIANAVYFKGDWKDKFDFKNTRVMDFHINPEKKTQVRMMMQESKFIIGHDLELGVQIVKVPYEGGKVSMILLVPTDRFGLNELEEKLTVQNLHSLASPQHFEEIVLSLPQFKVEYDFNIVPALKALGVNDLFNAAGANLQGMSGRPDLHVSGAYHKAFVEVNEEGTEAAAATAVVVVLNSLPLPPVKVTCDHPFMFLIKHESTQTVLFMGKYTSPPK